MPQPEDLAALRHRVADLETENEFLASQLDRLTHQAPRRRETTRRRQRPTGGGWRWGVAGACVLLVGLLGAVLVIMEVTETIQSWEHHRLPEVAPLVPSTHPPGTMADEAPGTTAAEPAADPEATPEEHRIDLTPATPGGDGEEDLDPPGRDRVVRAYDPTAEESCVRMLGHILRPRGEGAAAYDEAIAAYRAATEARCEGDNDNAYEHFEKARRLLRQIRPWQPEALAQVIHHRSLSEPSSGRYAEGEAHLEAALTLREELDYEGAYALLEQAELAYRQGRRADPRHRQRAEAARERASRLVSEAFQEGLRLIVLAREAEGAYWYDDAWALYDEAAEILGRCVFDESLLERAEAGLADANPLDPGYLDCLTVLARARGALKEDGPRAEELYRAAIDGLAALAAPAGQPGPAGGRGAALALGQEKRAVYRARWEARRLQGRVNDRRRACLTWAQAGTMVRATTGHYDHALRLLEAADQLWQEAESLFSRASSLDERAAARQPVEELRSLWARSGELYRSSLSRYREAGSALGRVSSW